MEIPQLRSLKARLVPEDLISVVCEAFECSRETILRKGKKRNLEPQKTSSFWYPLAKVATLGLLGRDEEEKQFAENLL
jgi:hypothetical protein